ncbi:MAG: hypothetical protein A2928_02710 [Candidatus Taylorbacteria bacterium RIFCSPLOWO2_01_FULL_45_15b]|uniref:Uncharacterized protein n=1 Tax=Candidatus Taylorbacteria bacterium RIFCSPLOWO2_01_FULL_45_15b TaxID=1802319 RepID=A0A1G2N9P7_9BACT|nr:MAG: hypothetical protein A2928_02710 [Candidatus Taylorbacteria bacterium RIFCSPLOWO2_01_FULL_45_15b]
MYLFLNLEYQILPLVSSGFHNFDFPRPSYSKRLGRSRTAMQSAGLGKIHDTEEKKKGREGIYS